MIGGVTYPNTIAPTKRGSYGPAVMLGLILLATVIVLILGIGVAGSLGGLGSAAYVLIGLVIVLAIMIVLVSRIPSRTKTSGMPDRIRIFFDRIEGEYDGVHRGDSAVLKIYFRDVEWIKGGSNSGGKEHFWVPGEVRAIYHFADPSAVDTMGMLHGPPVPPGCASVASSEWLRL